MNYLSTRDLYKLLSFEFDMTQTKMREACEVTAFLWQKDEDIKDMLPKIDKGLAKLFGADYRSPENIRKYERHRDIASDIDPNIIAKYRIEKGYSISKLASLADIPYETVRKIENSISEISSWRQYQNLAAIIGNDLLKADSKYKERKDKNRKPKKRSITFKNIATRGSKLSWEMGHKVVY